MLRRSGRRRRLVKTPRFDRLPDFPRGFALRRMANLVETDLSLLWRTG